MKDKIFEIEFLRIAGAAAIVLYHLTFRRVVLAGSDSILFPYFELISRYGYLAVNLFFLISGFVIVLSMRSKTAVGFALSRIDRLYPVYWISVAISSAAVYFFARNNLSLWQVLLNLTMVNDYFDVKDIDGVYWTLHVELKFYFLAFLVLLFKQFRNIQLWLYAWMACCLIYAVSEQPFFMGWFINPYYSSYFMAGITFYLVREKGFSLSLRMLLFFSLSLSLYYGTKQVSGFIPGHSAFDQYVASVIIISFYSIFLLIGLNKIAVRQVRWISLLAPLTYSVFLIHARMGKLLFDYMLEFTNKYFALGITTGIIIGLAVIIRYAVEKPSAGKLQLNMRHVLKIEKLFASK